MTSPLRAARAAFAFLTRIPVGGFPYTPDEWRWASAYFPLVGAAIGGATALVFLGLRPLGAQAAAYVALGASLLFTGAFHEDGLADTSDALGGARDREKVFAILKDSRVGAFGACAIVISIAGRAALLASADGRAVWGLVLVGAVARTGPVWQMIALPYATPEGSSKSRDVARAGPPQAILATAWTALAGAALTATRIAPAWRVAGVILASAVVTLVTAQRYHARAGGVRGGGFLGATEQLCELAGLAVIAWA